jgi:hypothetical protein
MSLFSPATTNSSCNSTPKPSGPPIVTIFGGDGFGAIVNAIISPTSSSVIAFDILDPGSGYTEEPFIVIEDLSGKGSGSAAQVTIGEISGSGTDGTTIITGGTTTTTGDITTITNGTIITNDEIITGGTTTITGGTVINTGGTTTITGGTATTTGDTTTNTGGTTTITGGTVTNTGGNIKKINPTTSITEGTTTANGTTTTTGEISNTEGIVTTTDGTTTITGGILIITQGNTTIEGNTTTTTEANATITGGTASIIGGTITITGGTTTTKDNTISDGAQVISTGGAVISGGSVTNKGGTTKISGCNITTQGGTIIATGGSITTDKNTKTITGATIKIIKGNSKITGKTTTITCGNTTVTGGTLTTGNTITKTKNFGVKSITVLSPGDGYLTGPDGSLRGNGFVWKEAYEGYIVTQCGDYQVVQINKPVNVKPGDVYYPPTGSPREITDPETIILGFEVVNPPISNVVGNPYEVILSIEGVVVMDSGFGYRPEDKIIVTPDNGAVLEPVINSQGQIISVNVISGGIGFDDIPEIKTNSMSGFNAQMMPTFKVTRLNQDNTLNNLNIPKDAKIITVVDCVGKF